MAATRSKVIVFTFTSLALIYLILLHTFPSPFHLTLTTIPAVSNEARSKSFEFLYTTPSAPLLSMTSKNLTLTTFPLTVQTSSKKPEAKRVDIAKQPTDPVITCYPLGLPNLREVVQQVLAGNKVPVGAINNNYVGITFNKQSANPCASQEAVDILLLIKSAAKNQENRDLVRSMWANGSYLAQVNATVKFAFLVGIKQFPTLPPTLQSEIGNHRDLILIDYVDNVYRNNTYKTMGSLKWTLEKCPQARYIALVDDDLFVNVKNLVKLLRRHSKAAKGNSTGSAEDFHAGLNAEFFAGKVRPAKMFKPHRNPKITWYVSWDEYPIQEFPVFFPGMTTIFSFHTLQEIYTASRYVKHLSIDDVYLGVIATKLGVRRINLGDNVIDFLGKTNCTRQPKFKQNVISIHLPKNGERRLQFWEECQT